MADNDGSAASLRVFTRTRALAFFIGHTLHGAANYGYYRNATAIMEALFDHLLIEVLAAFRRLYPSCQTECVLQNDTDIVVTRWIEDMHAGLRAASVMDFHRELIVLPSHYVSYGLAGAVSADWPGAAEYPQYLLNRLSGRPYALMFAHGAMGLNDDDRGPHQPPAVMAADFCTGLGLPFPEGEDRQFTLPGVLLLTLVGEQRGARFVRTPLQVSGVVGVSDRAE